MLIACDMHVCFFLAQASLCGFLSLVDKDIHYCRVSFVGDMAMKIGSVRSAKTRRAQDRMVKTGQKRDQNGCKRDRVCAYVATCLQ